MKKALQFIEIAVILMIVIIAVGCAHQHSMGEWIVDSEATCLENGSKHIECSSCGEIILSETIEADGHTESEWIIEVEATQKTEGLKYKKCTVCDEKLESEVIPCASLMSPEELAVYVQERTVIMRINGETNGTGFFIDENGTLVTCFHVIDNAFLSSTPSIEVELSSGARYSMDYVVKFDPAYDLAVLKINTKSMKTPYLKIAETEAATGAKVYACGAALGLVTGNFTDGQISSPSHKYALADAYISTAAISMGNSGGPLVNVYGEVIGVNAAGYTYGESMNVVIKTSNLDALRIVGNKNLSEFMQWHSFQTRDSLNMYIVDYSGEYNTYYYTSYIHAYHDETGAQCKYSSDTFLASSGVNGYDSMKYYYTYEYNKDQYVTYVDYLKTEGYVYDEKSSGDAGNGVFVDVYFNEIDDSYIKFVTYTNRNTGLRLIQVNMYVTE